jgi:hypothetical protein
MSHSFDLRRKKPFIVLGEGLAIAVLLGQSLRGPETGVFGLSVPGAESPARETRVSSQGSLWPEFLE